ncbi:unnamed protein product [Linum tenue]|uniref:RRM domain-containing protein n=1 Tax=Linum tenue TaxID=586396 RepID=A0AAV0N4E9_9ROSI|nr:unnamed protein product [Linum tenue]
MSESLVIDGSDSKFQSHRIDGGAADGKCDHHHHHQTEPTNETDGVIDGTQMPIESDRNQQPPMAAAEVAKSGEVPGDRPHQMSFDKASGFVKDMNNLVEMLSKLNPMAQEFVPPSLAGNNHGVNRIGYTRDFGMFGNFFNGSGNSEKRGKPNFNQGRRRTNSRRNMAQREDVIKRTVYVADIDQQASERFSIWALLLRSSQLLKSSLRVCLFIADRLLIVVYVAILSLFFALRSSNLLMKVLPETICCLVIALIPTSCNFNHSSRCLAEGAIAALSLSGTVLGYYPLKVLPSKTAIAPVNPTFLPRSEDEREMCARTVYCTNIDKKVNLGDVRLFFESFCGEVRRLRLLGDYRHSTRIAFVEFAVADSAIAALNCSGVFLGTLPIRVSPSKTPVRARMP